MTTLPSERLLEQVERLSVLAGYTRLPPAGRAELARAIGRHCETVPEAESLVTQILTSFERGPSPKEIDKIAFEHRSRTPRKPGCTECDGTGFISVKKPGATLDGVRSVGCVLFCDCHPGKRLSEAA